MKYGLEITQRTGEDEQIVAVDAEGEVNGESAHLGYKFDGADYELAIDGQGIVQKRSGEVKLYMQFVAGVRTTGVLSHGGNTGTFPIFTRSFSAEFALGGCTARCVYSDAPVGSADSPDTQTTIKIYPIED